MFEQMPITITNMLEAKIDFGRDIECYGKPFGTLKKVAIDAETHGYNMYTAIQLEFRMENQYPEII